jgi:hypothetical protein
MQSIGCVLAYDCASLIRSASPSRSFNEISDEDAEKSRDGKKIITGGKSSDDNQIDNRGDGRNVTDVLGEAADTAGVQVGTTSDGKPLVRFPDGSTAVGYPVSSTTGGPTIEIRTGRGKLSVKTREDHF